MRMKKCELPPPANDHEHESKNCSGNCTSERDSFVAPKLLGLLRMDVNCEDEDATFCHCYVVLSNHVRV